MMATMPVQKPGRSKQDYSTPDEFIVAVKRRLGREQFAWDLAADHINTKAGIFSYYSIQENSLSQDWERFAGRGWCWLNPPYDNITPWAKKCVESGVNIAFLVPASVGANWFRDYVDGKAMVLMLNGRLSFDGKNPYPKDCVLCLYGPGIEPGYQVWDWRRNDCCPSSQT